MTNELETVQDGIEAETSETVEYDEIDAGSFHHTPHLSSLRNCCRAEIVFLQVLAQQRADFAVVIDNDEMGAIAHRASAVVTNC